MQNEGKVRNCHTEDMNGKCENSRGYFCLDVDAFRENEICSEKQQAVGTHKGTVGEGELIYGGAGSRSNRAAPEAEQSPAVGGERLERDRRVAPICRSRGPGGQGRRRVTAPGERQRGRRGEPSSCAAGQGRRQPAGPAGTG